MMTNTRTHWWRRLGLVAATEIRQLMRQGAFYFSTIVTVLLFVAAGLLPQLRAQAADSPLASVESLLSNEPIPITQPTAVVDEANLLAEIPPEHTGLVRLPDMATAAQQFRAGRFDRYYHIPADYLTRGEVEVYSRYNEVVSNSNAALTAIINHNLRQQLEPATLARWLTEPFEIDWGEQVPPPTFRFMPPEIPPAQLNMALLVVGLFTFVLNNGGFWLLQAFEREKEARTLEVMLTSATPGQLLGGKLIALSSLSLGQVGLALGAGAAVYGTPTAVGGEAAVSAIGSMPTTQLLLSLPFLLMGYLLYSGFILGMGLLWPRTASNAQAQLILRVITLYPLAGAYLLLLDVHGWVAQFLSLFPLTAHVLMPLRLLLAAVPTWQILLSFVLLTTFTALLLRGLTRLNMLA